MQEKSASEGQTVAAGPQQRCRDLGYRASVAQATTGLTDDGHNYTDRQSAAEAKTLPP